MNKYVLSTLVAFSCIIVLTLPVKAEAQSNPHNDLVSGLGKINSAKHTIERYSIVYLNNEAVLGEHLTSKGSANRTGKSTFDSASIIKAEIGDEDSSYEVSMDFVRDGDTTYIKFRNPENKKIKNKWIKLTASEYKSFGKELELEGVFKLAELSDPEGEDTVLLQKTLALIEKHNFYVEYEEPTTKSKKGTSITTYKLEPNRATAEAYFTELSKVLTEDERKNSVVGIKDFMEAIKSKFFIDALVEESYAIISIDDKTKLPVEYTTNFLVPPYKNSGQKIQFFSNMKLEKVNQKASVKVPTKALTKNEALKLLGLLD